MLGIFDSGIGGLTVLKAIAQKLPGYQLLYLGDTARLPYGNRSEDIIYEFTKQGLDHLFKQGCQLVVIACNTMSAEALRKVQQEWLPVHYPDRKVLGVIRPIAEEAGKFKRIGVLATRATVRSGAYERELKAQNPQVVVIQQAAPLLVPLIEEGWLDKAETMKIVRHYVRPLKTKKIDSLILGCTHYPLLYKQFVSASGKNIQVIAGPEIVAEKLADYLKRHPEVESKLTKGDKYRFLVTDITEAFEKNAEKWLGQKITLEKIELK